MRRGTAVNACLLDCSKAFDKCQFDKLFEKLLVRGLPAVVVRILVFVYQEQEGFVKLGGKKSSTFKLTMVLAKVRCCPHCYSQSILMISYRSFGICSWAAILGGSGLEHVGTRMT